MFINSSNPCTYSCRTRLQPLPWLFYSKKFAFRAAITAGRIDCSHSAWRWPSFSQFQHELSSSDPRNNVFVIFLAYFGAAKQIEWFKVFIVVLVGVSTTPLSISMRSWKALQSSVHSPFHVFNRPYATWNVPPWISHECIAQETYFVPFVPPVFWAQWNLSFNSAL